MVLYITDTRRARESRYRIRCDYLLRKAYESAQHGYAYALNLRILEPSKRDAVHEVGRFAALAVRLDTGHFSRLGIYHPSEVKKRQSDVPWILMLS